MTVETADGETEAAAVLLATGEGTRQRRIPRSRPTGNRRRTRRDLRRRALTHDRLVDLRRRSTAAGRSLFTHLGRARRRHGGTRHVPLPPRRGRDLVLRVTFTDPQLAHVGMTATEARERFGERRVRVTRFDLAETDRARIDSTPEGMVMVVTASREGRRSHPRPLRPGR